VTLALIAWHTKIVLPLQALRLLSLSFSQRHCICAHVCVYMCVERVYVWRGSHVLSSLCQGYEMSVQGCWRYLPHSHNTNTHTAELSSGSHTHTRTQIRACETVIYIPVVQQEAYSDAVLPIRSCANGPVW